MIPDTHAELLGRRADASGPPVGQGVQPAPRGGPLLRVGLGEASPLTSQTLMAPTPRT